MKKFLVNKTDLMKSIVAILLLVMSLFVGGCSDSPAKINTIEPDTLEPGIITMVTIADEMTLRVLGKGEMYVFIEWENASPDSVATEWVFSLTEFKENHETPAYKFPVPHPDGIITVKGYITHFSCSPEYNDGYYGLTHLDVSGMPSLIELATTNNDLTELDVSQNTLLEVLFCNFNRINNLDLSKNIALRLLVCEDNLLTSLDISANRNLISLYSNRNQITSLDTSNNLLLAVLFCGDNPLKELDLSHNTSLVELYVINNHFENLDLSFNTKLKTLWLRGNNLKRLELSNHPALLQLFVENNHLDTEALNEIFSALPEVFHQKSRYTKDGDIVIWGNPGEDDCDKSIAEAKGWRFLEKATSYSEHGIDELKEKYINNIWRNQ